MTQPNPMRVTFNPWRPLRTMRRADAAAIQAVRATVSWFFEGSGCNAALGDLLGTTVDVEILDATRTSALAARAGALGLSVAGAEGSAFEAVVEVEPALAVAVVARALKRPPILVGGPIEAGELESLAGGLAAVAVAAGRRSTRGPLVMRAAGSSEDVLEPWRRPGRSVDGATLRVTISGEAYAARLLIAATPRSTASPGWDRARLARLGPTPLEIPVIAAASLAPVAEVAALDVGDAWMLGALRWGAGPRGSVVLAAPDSEWGARAELVENGSLVLRPGCTEVAGPDMPQDNENATLADALGDVPVLVRVEVGTARMTAREWAALEPGDVVALARGVADPVTLRVGGVEIAQGELVDLEGEIGVRILRRMGRDRAP